MRASEGVARINDAVVAGRASIARAANMFVGTAPPPPWPSPELYAAIDNALVLKDQLEVVVNAGDLEFDPKLSPKVAMVAAEVQKRAKLVETLAAKLDGRKAVVETQRLPNLPMLALGQLPRTAVLLGVLYLMWRYGDGD